MHNIYFILKSFLFFLSNFLFYLTGKIKLVIKNYCDSIIETRYEPMSMISMINKQTIEMK